MPSDLTQAFAFFLSAKGRIKKLELNYETFDRYYNEWRDLPEEARQDFLGLAIRFRQVDIKLELGGFSLDDLQNAMKGRFKRDLEKKYESFRRPRNRKTDEGTLREVFNVVCVTHYHEDEDGTFIPAEIGACRFSCEDGIVSDYHIILPVNLGRLSRTDAMVNHSQSTHNIPLKFPRHLRKAAKNYEEKLISFISEGSFAKVYIYTLREFQNGVKSTITGLGMRKRFEVLLLEDLFKRLFNYLAFPIRPDFADEILRCPQPSELIDSLACQWHLIEAPHAIPHCAMYLARSWIFNIFDMLPIKERLTLPYEDGRQFPLSERVDDVAWQLQTLNLEDEYDQSNEQQIFGDNSNPLGVSEPPPRTAREIDEDCVRLQNEIEQLYDKYRLLEEHLPDDSDNERDEGPERDDAPEGDDTPETELTEGASGGYSEDYNRTDAVHSVEEASNKFNFSIKSTTLELLKSTALDENLINQIYNCAFSGMGDELNLPTYEYLSDVYYTLEDLNKRHMEGAASLSQNYGEVEDTREMRNLEGAIGGVEEQRGGSGTVLGLNYETETSEIAYGAYREAWQDPQSSLPRYDLPQPNEVNPLQSEFMPFPGYSGDTVTPQPEELSPSSGARRKDSRRKRQRKRERKT